MFFHGFDRALDRAGRALLGARDRSDGGDVIHELSIESDRVTFCDEVPLAPPRSKIISPVST
jgi:hypothetical protein